MLFLEVVVAMRSPCLYHATDTLLSRLLCFYAPIIDTDNVDEIFGWIGERRHLMAEFSKVWKAVFRATSIRRTAPRQKDDIVEQIPYLRTRLMDSNNDGASISGEILQGFYHLESTR